MSTPRHEFGQDILVPQGSAAQPAVGFKTALGTCGLFLDETGSVPKIALVVAGVTAATIRSGESIWITPISVGFGGVGLAQLSYGNATNPGYAAFFTADGTRRGYVGWQGSANKLQIFAESGWGWEFNTTPTVSGNSIWHAGNFDPASKENAFSKGNIVQGSGVSLSGTLTGRLVGSGDVTITASGGGGAATLDDLGDVTISSPSTGQFLKYNGSQWLNVGHGLTYTDVGAAASAHNHDGTYARLAGSSQTISAPTTLSAATEISGSFKLSGLGADVVSAGNHRMLVVDLADNSVRKFTAAYARGWLDAAATTHSHVISDVTGLQPALDGKVPTTRTVASGTGLTGGGDLSTDRTLALATSGVSGGSYGAASGQSVPYFTVDAYGRLTAAASRNLTAADIGAGATLAFVTTSEVNFTGGQLTDGTYRTMLGTVRAGFSSTLAANALATGYILRIEAWGLFEATDSFTPKIRVKIGSSLTILFDIDEPNSGNMLAASSWNLQANVLIAASGASATTISRGWCDIHQRVYGQTDQVIRTTPSISGTLNTTTTNLVAVEFAGSSQMTQFRCTSVVATII